ncbi:NAD-P-binding protein, partial [Trametes punicea]
EPHPVTGETRPVILGHEFSGTIVELGPKVDTEKYRVGQEVAVEPGVPCRRPDCPACSSADTRNQCPRIWFLGLAGRGGGLSEYVAVDQEFVHVLPPNISLEVGALVEPLAVAWRATKRANVKPGDKVLILGAGPVGMHPSSSYVPTLRRIRLFGASWVGVSGTRPKRCELAKEHGASEVYDLSTPGGIDVVAETRRATGWGADVVIDCAGTQPTLDAAVQAVRPGGMIMNVAGWSSLPTINMNIMLVKEIVLSNSLAYSNDHPELLRAMAAGSFGDLSSLITKRVALQDFEAQGIKTLLNDKDQHGKSISDLDTPLR